MFCPPRGAEKKVSAHGIYVFTKTLKRRIESCCQGREEVTISITPAKFQLPVAACLLYYRQMPVWFSTSSIVIFKCLKKLQLFDYITFCSTGPRDFSFLFCETKRLLLPPSLLWSCVNLIFSIKRMYKLKIVYEIIFWSIFFLDILDVVFVALGSRNSSWLPVVLEGW